MNDSLLLAQDQDRDQVKFLVHQQFHLIPPPTRELLPHQGGRSSQREPVIKTDLVMLIVKVTQREILTPPHVHTAWITLVVTLAVTLTEI